MPLLLRNISFVPCIHRRVAFAAAVRREFLRERPSVIAVELPATLGEWIVRGVMRLPRLSAVCYPESGDGPLSSPGAALGFVPIDPCDALIEAVRLACEYGVPLEFIDLDIGGYQEPRRAIPDAAMIETTGYEQFAEAVAPYLGTGIQDAGTTAREDYMATRLRALAAEHPSVLAVVGVGHWARLKSLLLEGAEEIGDEIDGQEDYGLPEKFEMPAPQTFHPRALTQRAGVTLADIDEQSTVEAFMEIPHVAWLFDLSRPELRQGSAAFDSGAAVHLILQEAEKIYHETYRQTINLTQWKALLQFTRNLALTQGTLRPSFVDLVVGARGVVDGDYGFEVYELARMYPPQEGEPEDGLPRLRMKNGRGALSERDERFTMKPRQEPPETETIKLRFRRRPSKLMQAKWKEDWDQNFHFGICSWPPEDDVQERFMDALRKRALLRLSEDRKQVREFSTSMLDGLDIRETMRNWHTGKLYVQSTPQPQGRVGAVVVIFEDEPLGGQIFPWRTTLHAENQNESDISIYATALGQHVVGPRITRTQFGGILSIFPALGMRDIWNYELGGPVLDCSEQLLAAAILFSPDRYIAYMARSHARGAMRELAARFGKELIYLPLAGFSPSQLKKIQNFHILDGKDVRNWARDFIFDN